MAASNGLRMPVAKLLLRYAKEKTDVEGFPNGSRARSNAIFPLVIVPVLSLQRTSILPKFCIAERCFTITFLRAIARAPLESVTEVNNGRNCGIRPTAKAIAKRSDCNG